VSHYTELITHPALGVLLAYKRPKYGPFGSNCWQKTPPALPVHCTYLLIFLLCCLALLFFIVCCLGCVRIGRHTCMWTCLLLRYVDVETFSPAEHIFLCVTQIGHRTLIDYKLIPNRLRNLFNSVPSRLQRIF